MFFWALSLVRYWLEAFNWALICCNAEKRIKQKIERTISFIFDLFDSKTPADFIEKQPDAGNHISLTSVNTEKAKWKVRFLHTIDTPFGFDLLEWVIKLSVILRHTNQYDELSAWVRNYDLMLKEKRLQFASGRIRITRADKLLLEDRLFLKMQKILTGMSQYISLQSRVNTELGIFGSNRCRHDFQLPQPVRNYRQLISTMLAFLFRGNETKSAREGWDEEIKEFKSNVIRRYLKHAELFDCEEIANLRKMLDQSYKYILYSEWLDRNMHLTI